jgi:phospho-2-dehydro-3-deoxyheptonate aldolase
MSSGLSTPGGFKNGTDGSVEAAVNAILSASRPHSFLGINMQGRTSVVRTAGNRYGHLVLRGGGGRPNYDSVSVAIAEQGLVKAKLPQNIVVDLDVTVKKDLPVQVDWAGRLSEHLILAEATVDPSRVEIAGGKRILENLQTIYTEKVPLDRLREGVGVIEVPLAIQPASLKVASGSNEKVAVKYLTRKRD